SLQVLGPGAAAASDHPNPVILDEMLVILRQFFGGQLEYRYASLVYRQSCVRQNRYILGGVRAQIPDRVIHLLGAGRAVQANDVDVERLESGESGANLRT